MKRVLLTGLFCLIAGVAGAAPARFDEANARFDSGDIAGAAALYQEVLAKDGPSASVLFNLGNCEQRLGHFGPAILAYERARLFAPRDPDLRANLAHARKAAAVFEEPGRYPRLDAFFEFLSLNEWSWLVVGAVLTLGGLSVLRGCFRPSRRGLRQVLAATAVLAGLVVLVGGAALYLRRDERSRAVVLSEHATLRLSPFETAEVLGSPAAGRIVQLQRKDGGFYYVEVPGTELRGWMSGNDVSAIMR